MRQSGECVHGPYRHYSRWRLVVDKGGGNRENLAFDSESEAKKRKEELLKEIEGRTVNEAVRARVAHLRDQGFRASSIERAEKHLRRFFALDAKADGKVVAFANTGGMLDDLRPKRCEELYAALKGELAVDTHRNPSCSRRASVSGA